MFPHFLAKLYTLLYQALCITSACSKVYSCETFWASYNLMQTYYKYISFSPLSESIGSFRLTLKSMMLSYPIYMDTTGVFRRTNPQLPSNPMLHTFLLDENNEVLAVGNPLENEKIDRMFWRTVKEKLGTRQKEKAND